MHLSKMDSPNTSRKRSFYNTKEDKSADIEVLSKQRKLDGIADTSEVEKHMNQFFHEIKDLPGMKRFVKNTALAFVSQFSTSTNGHAQYEQSKLQKSSFLFPCEQIKSTLGISEPEEPSKRVSSSAPNSSSIAVAKEKNIVSLHDLYRYSPLSFPFELKKQQLKKDSTSNVKSILAMSKKSNMSKNSAPSQKLYYTADFATQLKEREQYKLLLEQFSHGHLFYSNNTLPAKKNLFEWTHSQISSSNESESVEKENAVVSDREEPLSLKIKLKKEHTLSPRLLEYKPFSTEWLEAMKKTIDRQVEESEKFIQYKECQVKAYEEKKAANHAEFLKRLQTGSNFNLSSDALETVGLETKLALPELTTEMNNVIHNAIVTRPSTAAVCKCAKYTLSQKDIETLVGSNWLNDEIINAYMTCITERSKLSDYPSVFAFNTYFYPRIASKGHDAVKRWTKKDDIFSYDLNLIPMHLGLHWCLGVFDHRSKKIQYYDSMNSKEQCLPIFKKYLMAESLDKKKKELDPDWTVEKVQNIPPQLNGSDCGVFTLKYAEYISRDAKITFTQEHMPYFRRKIIYELVAGGIK